MSDVEATETLFERLDKRIKKNNYSQKEVIYHLEVLPINRKSVILNYKSNGK